MGAQRRVALACVQGLAALSWGAGPVSAQAGEAVAVNKLSVSELVDITSLGGLSDLVVTDAKIPQSPSTVTQKVQLIHSEAFELQPGIKRDLAELVSGTSGQFVNMLLRNVPNWGSFGGLGPQYNSFLLDGVPMDAMADSMTIDPAAIERIERYKGPASVLYPNYLSMDFAGNETPMTGTTNFILKKDVSEAATRFSLGRGTWNTTRGTVYRQARVGDLSYVVGVMGEGSDYTDSYNVVQEAINKPDYLRAQAFASLNQELGRSDHNVSLFVQGSSVTGDSGRPNREFRHAYQTLNLSYENAWTDDILLQLKTGYRHQDRQFDNDLFPASLALDRQETTRQTIWPTDLTVQFKHLQGSLATVGMDHQRARYTVDNLYAATGQASTTNDARATATGLFAQEKYIQGDWVWRGGLRWQHTSYAYDTLGGATPEVRGKAWDKTLWSAGARYNLSKALALYANAGSSFKAPSPKQIGGTVPASTPSAGGEIANPTLQPESGLGRDLGASWQAGEAFKVDARAFYNTLNNAIVTGAVNAAQSRSDNVGSVKAQGLELDLNYAPDQPFVVFANATWTHSRISRPGFADEDGSNTPFVPDLVMNLGAHFNAPRQWTVSPKAQWVSRYHDASSRASRKPLGQDWLLDLRISHQLTTRLLARLDLINITNKKTPKPFGMQDPGFNSFLSLSCSY